MSLKLNEIKKIISNYNTYVPESISKQISQYKAIEVNKAKNILSQVGVDNNTINKMLNKTKTYLLTYKESIVSKNKKKVGFANISELRNFLHFDLGISLVKIKKLIKGEEKLLSEIYKIEKKNNKNNEYVFFNRDFFTSVGGNGNSNEDIYPNWMSFDDKDKYSNVIEEFNETKENIKDRMKVRNKNARDIKLKDFNLETVEKAVDTLKKNEIIKPPKYATFTKEIGNTGMSVDKAKSEISNTDALRFYDADSVAKMFAQRGFRVSRLGGDGKRDFTWAGKNVKGWDSYDTVDGMWEVFGDSGRGVKDTAKAFGNDFRGGTKLIESEFIDNSTKKKIKKVLKDNIKKEQEHQAKQRARLVDVGEKDPIRKWYDLTLDDYEMFIKNRDKFYEELKDKRNKLKKKRMDNKKDLVDRQIKIEEDEGNERTNKTLKGLEKQLNKIFKKKKYNFNI